MDFESLFIVYYMGFCSFLLTPLILSLPMFCSIIFASVFEWFFFCSNMGKKPQYTLLFKCTSVRYAFVSASRRANYKYIAEWFSFDYPLSFSSDNTHTNPNGENNRREEIIHATFHIYYPIYRIIFTLHIATCTAHTHSHTHPNYYFDRPLCMTAILCMCTEPKMHCKCYSTRAAHIQVRHRHPTNRIQATRMTIAWQWTTMRYDIMRRCMRVYVAQLPAYTIEYGQHTHTHTHSHAHTNAELK